MYNNRIILYYYIYVVIHNIKIAVVTAANLQCFGMFVLFAAVMHKRALSLMRIVHGRVLLISIPCAIHCSLFEHWTKLHVTPGKINIYKL